jgi:hypothetical protein
MQNSGENFKECPIHAAWFTVFMFPILNLCILPSVFDLIALMKHIKIMGVVVAQSVSCLLLGLLCLSVTDFFVLVLQPSREQ